MDQLSPETLEHYVRSGTITTHQLSDDPRILLAIDAPRQTISIMVPQDGSAVSTDTLRRVSTSVLQRDGSEWAQLTLDARGMYTEAYGMLLSVAQALRDGATFAAATSAAMTNMKTLLARKVNMSEERQIGLVGELMVLESVLEHHGETDALNWWLGPLAEERDFAFPDFDAEVKTTLSEDRTHVIHGAGQLEPSPGRTLWLVSVQITRAGGDHDGVRLSQLVSRVSERLTTERERYIAHLSAEGWHSDDAALYPTAYALRSRPAAFLVDEEFPAVTRARLRTTIPHSELVSDVTYRVNLNDRLPGAPGSPLGRFVAVPKPEED